MLLGSMKGIRLTICPTLTGVSFVSLHGVREVHEGALA